MLQEVNVFDYIKNNGVECPAGLAFHQLDRVIKQSLINSCMYSNGVDRYEAIEHLEEFVYDSEGNAMGYV